MKINLLRIQALVLAFVLTSTTVELLPKAVAASVNTTATNGGVFKLRIDRSQAARRYLLGPYDQLTIEVLDSPEYSHKDVFVQPDGKLMLAPLGPIHVLGLSLDELHDMLVEKYRFYLNDPQVTIRLERTKSLVIPVSGAVMRPGSIELIPNVGNLDNLNLNNGATDVVTQRRTPLLSNALLSAGGTAYDADLAHITVTNSLDGSHYEVDLLSYVKDGDVTQDLYLVTGDTINVPRLASPMAVNPDDYKLTQHASFAPRNVPIKVMGYVRSPGLVQLNPEQSTNLNSAIASAGGYLQDSAYLPPKVRISRQTEQGRLMEWWVDPRKDDALLMPNDIVYVPQKALPRGGLLFDYMARVISPFNGVAGTYNNWALIFDPTRYSAVRNTPTR
jgi:protein involved in polysaccharide export with SLBB domain